MGGGGIRVQTRFQQKILSFMNLPQDIAYSSCCRMQEQFGCWSKNTLRMYFRMRRIWGGSSEHSYSGLVLIFFYNIFSYFYFLFLASMFCHGSCPLKKQISMQIIPSTSSLLPCSIPKCVLIEAQRAVPVKFLLSLQGMCWPSLVLYFLASPKSIIKIVLDSASLPVRKLSGLISRCINPWECTYSIRSSICNPIIKIDLVSNALLCFLNKLSKESPKIFITMIFYSPSVMQSYTFNSPRSWARPSVSRIWRILNSQYSWGFLQVLFYTLRATFSFLLLTPRQIQPNAPDPILCPITVYSPQFFIPNQQYSLITIQPIHTIKISQNSIITIHPQYQIDFDSLSTI